MISGFIIIVGTFAPTHTFCLFLKESCLFVHSLHLLLHQFVFPDLPGQIFIVSSEEELKGLHEDNALAFRKDEGLWSLYFKDRNGWKPIQVQDCFEYNAMKHAARLAYREQELFCFPADATPGDREDEGWEWSLW